MHRFVLVNSEDGFEIYVNLLASSAGDYLSRRPYVVNLIKEVLKSQKISGKRSIIECDMGREIGTTDVVATSEKDNIYYAQALKSLIYSRFAKNRYPQQSKRLTIILEKDSDNNYEVIDTWIGPSSPAFPGDANATAESKTYWENHALVQDARAIQTKSITKDCPY